MYISQIAYVQIRDMYISEISFRDITNWFRDITKSIRDVHQEFKLHIPVSRIQD